MVISGLILRRALLLSSLYISSSRIGMAPSRLERECGIACLTSTTSPSATNVSAQTPKEGKERRGKRAPFYQHGNKYNMGSNVSPSTSLPRQTDLSFSMSSPVRNSISPANSIRRKLQRLFRVEATKRCAQQVRHAGRDLQFER